MSIEVCVSRCQIFCKPPNRLGARWIPGAHVPSVPDRPSPTDPAARDTRSVDGRSKPENVAVGINYGAFVLAPVGVFRHVDLSSDRQPLLCECIRIIDPEISRLRADSRAWVRDNT